MKQLVQRTSYKPTILTSLCPWELERSVLCFPDLDCDCGQFGTLIHLIYYYMPLVLILGIKSFHPENKYATNKYLRVFFNGSVLNRNVSAVFILVLRPSFCLLNEAS